MKTVSVFSLLLPAVLGGFFLTSCADNPADDVEKATVEDAPDTSASAPAAEEAADVEKVIFVFSDSSKIEFTGSKVTGSHDGGFTNFVGKFEVAGDSLAAKGRHSVIIDMNSVYSDSEKLTEHLKSGDFFGVEDFPTARFDLDSAVSKGDDQYELSGTLDLHGVAKKITFPATVKVAEAANLVDFSAEFAINRKDFNIVYPGKPDDLIRDEVVMKLEVSAIPGEPKDLQIGINGAPPVTDAEEDTRPGPGEGRRGDGKGKGKGKGGRPDFRNMTEEERAQARQEFMARIDTNGDGNIGKDEVDERMWGFIGAADKDGDNQVTEAERTEFRAEREAERTLRELNGEDPGPRFGGKGRGPGGGGRGGDGGGDGPTRPALDE